MTRTLKLYALVLLLIMGGMLIFENTKPQPLDWRKTYNEKDKIPYGTYVLFDQLKFLFPHDSLQIIHVTPYEYFNKHTPDSSDNVLGTYMRIDAESHLDTPSVDALLNYVHSGNHAFIASNRPAPQLLSALGAQITQAFLKNQQSDFVLANPQFKKDSTHIKSAKTTTYFTALDSLKTTVLGYKKVNKKRVNFVKITHGKGFFIILLDPELLTNYHLLKKPQSSKYSAAALAYIPQSAILFDSQNKVSNSLGDSPLRIILKSPALRYAWLLGLATLALFIGFNAKRKQRIVPTIKPLKNSSVEFLKTISNLYYETHDHTGIIRKKITYFLESIRHQYYLDTGKMDAVFIKKLSLKSEKTPSEISELIHLIVHLTTKKSCTKADLLKLNTAIEDFYKE